MNLRKIWWFIWEDNSIWSWIVNIIIAFVLIKFIVYPGLGLAFGTNYPVVAVMSSSMEHNPSSYNRWWADDGNWYLDNNITQEQFEEFKMHNGFNKGDIIILFGKNLEKIKQGDIIVFKSHKTRPKPDPIIHRVVKIKDEDNNYFQTKGDNNPNSIENKCDPTGCINEIEIGKNQFVGKAVMKIPYLGYVKIWATDLAKLVGLVK